MSSRSDFEAAPADVRTRRPTLTPGARFTNGQRSCNFIVDVEIPAPDSVYLLIVCAHTP